MMSTQKGTAAPDAGSPRPPCMDAQALETRRLLAVDVSNGILFIEGTDAGDVLTYGWVQTTGSAVTLSSPSAVMPSFTAPDNGTYTFDLTVSDGKGGTATDQVVITASNVAPTITGIAVNPLQTITWTTVTLTGSATDPSSADTLAGFAWRWAVDGGSYSAFGAPNANTFSTSFAACALPPWDWIHGPAPPSRPCARTAIDRRSVLPRIAVVWNAWVARAQGSLPTRSMHRLASPLAPPVDRASARGRVAEAGARVRLLLRSRRAWRRCGCGCRRRRLLPGPGLP